MIASGAHEMGAGKRTTNRCGCSLVGAAIGGLAFDRVRYLRNVEYDTRTQLASRRDWCPLGTGLSRVFHAWFPRRFRDRAALISHPSPSFAPCSLSFTMPNTEVERREGRGRCLIAAKDFGLGDLVSASYSYRGLGARVRQQQW